MFCKLPVERNSSLILQMICDYCELKLTQISNSIDDNYAYIHHVILRCSCGGHSMLMLSNTERMFYAMQQ